MPERTPIDNPGTGVAPIKMPPDRAEHLACRSLTMTTRPVAGATTESEQAVPNQAVPEVPNQIGYDDDPQQFRNELAARSAELETAPAGSVISWAVERFGGDLALACSFQDAVIIDLAVAVDPRIEVVFLDTEAHFPETLAYVEEIRARYDLNLTVTTPGPDAAAWPCGTEQCCQWRKVQPLRQALAGRRAWLTGLKRVDASTRTEAPIVAYDEQWGMVKINPLATWTDADIAGYEADHGIPRHPLFSAGYLSIGCAPTTRPVAEGEDPRAGRWSGSGKVECGLHV